MLLAVAIACLTHILARNVEATCIQADVLHAVLLSPLQAPWSAAFVACTEDALVTARQLTPSGSTFVLGTVLAVFISPSHRAAYNGTLMVGTKGGAVDAAWLMA